MEKTQLNQKWEKFIYNQIVSWGYGSDDIESNKFEVGKDNNPVIRIKFKNVQNAYGITRTFKTDRLIWVSHKKNYYFGFQSCYTSEVSIRPKISLNNNVWDSVLVN